MICFASLSIDQLFSELDFLEYQQRRFLEANASSVGQSSESSWLGTSVNEKKS